MPDGESLFHVKWQTAAAGLHEEPKIPTGGATKVTSVQEAGQLTRLYAKILDLHQRLGKDVLHLCVAIITCMFLIVGFSLSVIFSKVILPPSVTAKPAAYIPPALRNKSPASAAAITSKYRQEYEPASNAKQNQQPTGVYAVKINHIYIACICLYKDVYLVNQYLKLVMWLVTNLWR